MNRTYHSHNAATGDIVIYTKEDKLEVNIPDFPSACKFIEHMEWMRREAEKDASNELTEVFIKQIDKLRQTL